jgi:hypothetical protein
MCSLPFNLCIVIQPLRDLDVCKAGPFGDGTKDSWILNVDCCCLLVSDLYDSVCCCGAHGRNR